MVKDRFKSVRKSLNFTQKELADKLNKDVTTVQYYEYGKLNITDGVLLNLQEKFNVNIDWLRTGEGEMFLPAKKESSNVSNTDKGLYAFPKEKDRYDFVEIPAYLDVKASAGTGAFVGMEVSETVQISKKLIKNTHGLVILSVAGDSMEPAILNKDKIIIDTNDKYTLKKNKIYVIRKDNELYIKRYNDNHNNMLFFTSDNPKYSSIVLNKDDNSAVIGRLKGIFMREVN